MNLEGDPGGGEPSLLFFGMVVETYVRVFVTVVVPYVRML